MSRVFYINAHKMVRLQQVEIEAPDRETAVDEYLRMAKRGDLEVDSYDWNLLDEGDLDVEDHGEGEDAPF